MDRRFVYANEVVREIDILTLQKDAMYSIAKLTETIYGTPTFVVGMQVVPVNPNGLAVSVQPGMLYQQEEFDSSAWSSLPGDVRLIEQQAFSPNPQQFTITPPPIVSEAQWYLLQVQFVQQDTNSQVLQYFNPAMPSVPLNGPGGSGSAQPQDRIGTVLIELISGLPAGTGDEVKPPPSIGFTPLAYIHVIFGQSAITNADIIDMRSTLATLPQHYNGGLQAHGITPGAGGNLDASTLAGHPINDFVLQAGATLTGLASLGSQQTFLAFNDFSAGLAASQVSMLPQTADLIGQNVGTLFFNAVDDHIKLQLPGRLVRVLTEADNGTGGIIDANSLNGLSSSQIIADINAAFQPQLTNTVSFTKYTQQSDVVLSSGTVPFNFSYPVRSAIVSMTGVDTSVAGPYNLSYAISGNTVNVTSTVPTGGTLAYTVTALG